MKKFLAVMILMLSLMNVACAETSDEFCWKYFATLNKDENIFYSPYGIHDALSILANGASGDTQREILNALSIDKVEALNAAHKNFSENDNFAEATLLLIDKKVFGRGLDKNFKRVVTAVYNSDVLEADFANNLDGEKQKISRRVSDKTKNFIPNYKSIVTSDALTDLLNVVYFKGDWAIPFKARDTSRQDFKNRDGSKVKVDMMGKVFKTGIAYCADGKFKGIKLPYTANAAMYLILPADDNALNVAELWDAETFSARADFLDTLKKSPAFDGEVVVRLPKFELDIENNLVENFKAMGIKKSFTDDAEFFYIVKDTSLKIGNAQHRAKVKVDEQGTEAAAVTEITIVEATAVPDFQPPRRVYFLAERPFIFLIREVESGTILFAGAVNKF